MNSRILRFLTIALLIAFGTASCDKDEDEFVAPPQFALTSEYSNEVALDWMHFYLDIERFTPGYRPPVSARTAGYIGLTAYEAVVGGMPDYNPISGNFFGLSIPKPKEGEEYHWPTCLHAAYTKSFGYFFPNAPSAQQQRLFTLEQKYNDKFSAEVPLEVYNRSKAYGETVAALVYEWSQSDVAGHQAYLRNNDPSYAPPSGPGLWQPTYPDYSAALLPHWGEVRTFAATDDDSVPAPLAYSEDPNSELYVQAKEVMVKVNKIKAGNPEYPEDEWIADFWSDDCPTKTFTPAARWIAITNQLIEEKGARLDLAVFAYAKVGMGLNDAGVRCWHEKYRYNVLRPIDYIRQVMAGQEGWNSIMCPTSGNFLTPNFPAYPSGHATFGGVAAEILTDLFGFNYAMTDRCHEGRVEFLSTPRSYKNFYEMAQENAYSRLPIGVHYKMDAEAGVELGYQIGRKINNLPWKK
jgi:hypothetical protein